jgi:lipopolysaccharide transport system permease protein
MSESGPIETTLIRPHRGWVSLDLAELWRYRELIALLGLRDIKVRYKQSLLGIGWAVIQPLLTMVVFTVLFTQLMGRDRMPTLAGIPYELSTLCALVPWQLFATALISSGNSLVTNQSLITKVYFPRLVAPIAPLMAALVDFALAMLVLVAMMLFYGIVPGWAVLTLPFFVLLAVITALAVSLWLSALNALYRDIRHIIPFMAQIWMFATPVVYTAATILTGQPDWVRLLYGLNPMVGVVEGFRWALLGGANPPWLLVASSAVVVSAVLIGGLHYFRRMERHFADLV